MAGQPFNTENRTEYIPDTPYKFSPEEMRVLQRCNRESFYQRSLPLSTLFSLGTYWCVKSGYLKPHPQWGATWKMVGASIVGYFIGKISYQQRCAEYFMALPESQVGEMLRKRRQLRGGSGGTTTDTIADTFGGGPMSTFGGLPSTEVYSDLSDSRSTYQDLDTDRPLNEGLSDVYRPSVDFPALEEETILPPTHGGTVTYDDLRRKNREEYINKNTKMYRNVPSSEDVPSTVGLNPDPLRPPPDPSRLAPEPAPSRPSPYSKQKNIYGDVWEK